eukprot:gnl/Spiro4/1955_TR926_c0_g2_i2.p1 gnl/Spiro4/1955_TR926_c0_g2~~gnl/Spiro4/1955_TR926_c0_g2_i2.p1  ORF type:complete len:225 (+),score=22.00 gnl/Spiro4/1955_TR926_c0_g2_i2:61-735(+)
MSLAERLGVNSADALTQLDNVDVAFIVDDSGSMGTLVDRETTRFQDLFATLCAAIELTAHRDAGIDVYFMNRPHPILQVKSPSEIAHIFDMGPSGGTPIADCLEQVVKDKKGKSGRELLVVASIDSEPDIGRTRFRLALEAVVRSRQVHVAFMPCTDDEALVSWLCLLDQQVPNVFTMKSYLHQRAQAGNEELTRSTYAASLLLGGLSAKEKPGATGGCSCLVS